MADVISRNPFALLDDEDGVPAPAPRKAEPKAAPKEIAPAASARTEPRSDRGPREDRPRRGGYGRGGYAGGEVRDRNVPPRLARQENGGDSALAPQAEGRENGRGGYRGRGRGGFRGGEFRGRGGRGGRGRDYDRHSASGRVDSEKQEVTGGWGGLGSELEAAPNESPIENAEAKLDSATADEKPEEAKAEPVPKTAEELAAEEERRKEEEFLAKQKTLEQYLAEKSAAKPTLEGANTAAREVNAGVDPNLLKSNKKFERKAEEDIFFAGKTKAAPKSKAPKEQKQVVDIDFRFEDTPRRGGRGRGGDRPGFGGRGRGGDRPSGGRGRAAGPAVNVTDQNAFPGLKK